MKNLSRCLLFVLFWSPLLVAQPERKVVVISLDGFPAYALQDSRLPIPTLRKLMREGASATVMQPINPTVTWPNHTAMVTGVSAAQHGVLFNGLLTHPEPNGAPKIEPWRDKTEMVHAPTVYDLAFQSRLSTAQVDWVAIYGAKNITWKFPELPDPNGKIEQELVSKDLVTEDQLKTFNNSSAAWRDRIWTDAAIDILEAHHPNLMLLHLLDLDTINHGYGPMSEASLNAMAFLDDRVRQVLDALQKDGDLEHTSVLVVSDHGFRSITHAIHANVLLRQKGLIQSTSGKETSQAWVVPEGGSAMVYVTDPKRRAELIPQLRSLLERVEGVDHVYGQEDFPRLGLPGNSKSDQSPDLFLTAKPEYSFSGGDEGEVVTPVTNRGSHGYINTDPKMGAIFIAWGANIRKGVHLDAIQNRDVAPTIAALLGLKMKDVQGRVLSEIIQ